MKQEQTSYAPPPMPKDDETLSKTGSSDSSTPNLEDCISIMDELEGILCIEEGSEEFNYIGSIDWNFLGWGEISYDELNKEDGHEEADEEEEEETNDDDHDKHNRGYMAPEKLHHPNVTVKQEVLGLGEDEKTLSLNLNYDDVMEAWSHRRSPWAAAFTEEMGEVPVMEERTRRKARVMRYKEKRQTRLFSKKIRYQVRKINAEKRPRLKGRFVKRIPDKMRSSH